jgi:hypothetical protein
VKCSLIDEYVKKPSAHGMSTFNGSSVSVVNKVVTKYVLILFQVKDFLTFLVVHMDDEHPHIQVSFYNQFDCYFIDLHFLQS